MKTLKQPVINIQSAPEKQYKRLCRDQVRRKSFYLWNMGLGIAKWIQAGAFLIVEIGYCSPLHPGRDHHTPENFFWLYNYGLSIREAESAL
ncbi:hypothetical protein AVEN_178188-1 [Araneus ventricosus]|uniref:Uncharacterized protein n=1 Tax=Araneus ventricosus TaxID=182803 RepID=A0A4Y2VZH1_ARAVE|nr:hypothetical protein AVEN_178188-1 [Araneus ventricosus]